MGTGTTLGADALTGSRIRERRVMAGIKQAALAKMIGISASYLNLIEHNRRKIGGKLLLDVAQSLGVSPQTLTEGAEAALIATLHEAAEETGLAGEEADRADEFAGRFPGWADVLVATRRRISGLEETVEALSDRLAHDPHLAASMHELLTTAAAIRSTASILADNRALEPEWRDRFHTNINEDSRRLSDSAQSLVSYLESDTDTDGASNSPQDEVEAFLQSHGLNFPQLENGSGDGAIANLVDGSEVLHSAAARHIARGVLEQIERDAAVLPIPSVRQAFDECGVDPSAIARKLHQPPARVLRRMAALQELQAGLVVCDRSGTVIFRKSVQGFTVPRHGSCCPLWPLFAVLGQPGMLVSERVAQLGRSEMPFDAFATSEAQTAPEYNKPPLVQAVMLLVPATPGGESAAPMGSTCRICPSTTCRARREPSILAVSG